jgi:hypothetical protein
MYSLEFQLGPAIMNYASVVLNLKLGPTIMIEILEVLEVSLVNNISRRFSAIKLHRNI